jgi:hypothetical protein
LGKRLKSEQSTTVILSQALDVPGPFSDYADFKRRALCSAETAVRIYEIDGHATRVVVPEAYATSLDQVRSLRLRAAQSCLDHEDKLCDSISVDEARATLSQHPLRSRVLPEELAVYLDEVPDSRYFRRLFLLDQENPEDRWTRQEYSSPFFVSAMATEPNGDVLLFRTERNEFLRTNIFHEWTHGLQKQASAAYQAFTEAVELGWRQYVPRPYALRSYAEHWAVVGEELLHVDAQRFLEVANKAPIRTVIWMLALEDSLNATVGGGLFSAALRARLEMAMGPVLVKAREALACFLAEIGSGNQSRACRITLFLNERLGVRQ